MQAFVNNSLRENQTVNRERHTFTIRSNQYLRRLHRAAPHHTPGTASLPLVCLFGLALCVTYLVHL